MDLIVKGIHYHVSEATQGFIKDKMGKVWHHVQEDLTRAEIAIVHDKDFLVESHLKMKWGVVIHIEERAKELYAAIEKMIKRLDHRIIQEREKHHVSRPR